MSALTPRWMSQDEFKPLFDEWRPKVFAETGDFKMGGVFAEQEEADLKRLGGNLSGAFVLRLAMFDGDRFVGWSFGRQETFEKFYMVNSAVLPEYRRQGLYTRMMKMMVERAAQEGFQIIYSRHVMTNSAILIAKLKAGFILTGFDLNDQFGMLAQLSYYTNAKRREFMDVRSGQRPAGP